MKIKGSLTHSQQIVISPHSETDESRPHFPFLFL